jgi:chromosome segregation ATPase
VTDNDGRPATKGDLAAVRTELRSDIAQLDAKIGGVEKRLDARIGGLDAKIDGIEKRLDSRINGLAGEIVKTNGRMADMEQRLQTRMDAGFDRVTKTLDSVVAKLETYGRETVTIALALDAHGKTLRDHESRIAAIGPSRPT